MRFSSPQPMSHSVSVLLCVVVCHLLLVVLPHAGCGAQSPTLSFSESTDTAPWDARQLAFSTAISIGGPTGELPFIAGGAISTGLIDPYKGMDATGYFNDVWQATDPAGKSWMQMSSGAEWSKRSSGGLIDVIIVRSGLVQILVLVGGRQAAGDAGLLNDVWSSLDIGKTWQLSTVAIQFTPRENFGLVIAKGYNDNSTVYAYVVGGYGLQKGDESAPARPLNDVYYTKGMGTNPWVTLPVANPDVFTGRYGFGIAPYNNGNGLVVVGGFVLQDGTAVAVDEVWALIFNNSEEPPAWKQLSQSAPPPAVGYVGLLLSTKFYYLFCGTDFNTISQDVYYSDLGGDAWQRTEPSPQYQPPRLQFSTILDTEGATNRGVILAGNNNFKDGNDLNDVWATVLQ